jgi:hypothetical protein
VEVDPGMHTFEFKTPDGRKTEKTVMVPESDKWVRVAVTLPAAPAPPAAPPPTPEKTRPVPGRSVASGAPAADRPRTAATRASPWKSVGLATAGVGAVGLGVGTFFGFDAMSKRSAAGCNSQDACLTAGAKNELDASRRSGDFATAFLVAGGALSVSGAVLWALAPGRPVSVATRVDTGHVTVVLSGSW